jgi:hypothetical protein
MLFYKWYSTFSNEIFYWFRLNACTLLKELLRDILLMDVSEVKLFKPVHTVIFKNDINSSVGQRSRWTNSMELSPCLKSSATDEISRILWDLKVQYCVHKSLPLVSVMTQMNPVHTLTAYFFRSILILSSHLHLGLPNGVFPSGFPNKALQALFFHVSYIPCPSHSQFDHSNNIMQEVQIMKPPHYASFFSLLFHPS